MTDLQSIHFCPKWTFGPFLQFLAVFGGIGKAVDQLSFKSDLSKLSCADPRNLIPFWSTQRKILDIFLSWSTGDACFHPRAKHIFDHSAYQFYPIRLKPILSEPV